MSTWNDSAGQSAPGSRPAAVQELSGAGAEEPVQQLDPARVRRLMRRVQNGETLAAEEQSYLQRARQAMQKQNTGQPLAPEEKAFLDEARRYQGQARPAGTNNPARQAGPPPPPPRESTGLIPLDQMTAQERYQGQDGGLYGGARNQAPTARSWFTK